MPRKSTVDAIFKTVGREKDKMKFGRLVDRKKAYDHVLILSREVVVINGHGNIQSMNTKIMLYSKKRRAVIIIEEACTWARVESTSKKF